MVEYPVTPDGRYFVVRGRLWRCSNPALAQDVRQKLVQTLMQARRAKQTAMLAGDVAAREEASAKVEKTKRALGERGPVWWQDGTEEVNRHMAKNTVYAEWFAGLSRSAVMLQRASGHLTAPVCEPAQG